ncbi:MAG TPA: hypothetical protein VGB85_24260 [Nannocystis sp.]
MLAALLAACGVTIPGAGTNDATGPPDITVSTSETDSSSQGTGADATVSPDSTIDDSSKHDRTAAPVCGAGVIDPADFPSAGGSGPAPLAKRPSEDRPRRAPAGARQRA